MIVDPAFLKDLRCFGSYLNDRKWETASLYNSHRDFKFAALLYKGITVYPDVHPFSRSYCNDY